MCVKNFTESENIKIHEVQLRFVVIDENIRGCKLVEAKRDGMQ